METRKIWGVWAMRGIGSIFGADEMWTLYDGEPVTGTHDEMLLRARRYNDDCGSMHVRYEARLFDEI